VENQYPVEHIRMVAEKTDGKKWWKCWTNIEPTYRDTLNKTVLGSTGEPFFRISK